MLLIDTVKSDQRDHAPKSLPDVFLQCARIHPCGKRGFGFYAFLHSVVKEIRHDRDYSRMEL